MEKCEECGQVIPNDRADIGICERCEEYHQLQEERDALQEEVEELKDEIHYKGADIERYERKAQIHDSIRELIHLGCSCAEAIDYAFCARHGHDKQEWAQLRSVSPPAVYNNLSSAQAKLDKQSSLTAFPVDELPELGPFAGEELTPAITRVEADDEPEADGMGTQLTFSESMEAGAE